MPKKAIFAQAEQEYWIDVAARLKSKYNWEICYLVGGKKYSRKISELFPDSVFHIKEESRNGVGPAERDAALHSPIDKTLLSAMSLHESIFMKILDRYDFDGLLTYNKRISLYHTQLMYWKGVLEHFTPDIVVFRITPHTSYDYILYALCRVMKIPTVMFERTSLPGMVYPVDSFEDGSRIIRSKYAEELPTCRQREISLSPETTAHLERLSKTFAEAMPYHLKYKLTHHKKGGDVGGNLTTLSHFAGDLIRTLWHKGGSYKYLQKCYHENTGRFKRKKLFAHYNRLAKPVDFSVPYIFLALQCEPERQTCPTGGVFGHQYLMVDLLSKLLPDGWKLYVKEHVSQFKEYQAAERSKSFDFYDRIASKPNVDLVPLSYTSFELIDHAKASATVSGTVGWESVVRGKPAFLFGHSWYRDCKGIFVIHTIEECEKAIQLIQNGFDVDRNELTCFAKVVETCSIRGYIDKFYENMNIVSHDENVENLAKTIHEFIS